MTVVKTDNFTNTNGTDIESHDPNWYYMDSGVTGDIEIEVNVARCENLAAAGLGAAYTATFDDDQYSQAKVTAVTATDFVGLCARVNRASPTQNFYLWNTATSLGFMEKYVGGTWSAIDETGAAVSVNDVLRWESIGDQHRTLINSETDMGPNTDSSLATGDVGIYFYMGNSLASLDDWEGGNLGVGSVKVATTRVACKTTTGLQTITTPDLGGLTPTAALLICTNATADGTAADHVRMSIGAVVSATERWAISSNDSHGYAQGASVRIMTEDEVVMMLVNGGAGGIDFEADFDSWVTNGMVIDWGSTNPSSGYLLTVIFFAGSDVVAHADTVSLPATTGANTDVTAPGFEPAFVIFANTRSAINDTKDNHFAISFGIAANDGADTNFSLNLSGANGAPDSDNAVLALNDSIQENLFQTNVFGGHYVDTYDADGFTVRCIRNGGGDSPYLAIGFGGAVDVWLGDISTPISTGDDVETGPGFVPQALIGGFNYTSLGFQGGATPSNDVGSIYSAGIGIATPTAEYSNVVTSEDAAATTNTQSLSDDVFANVQPHIGGTAQDIVCTGPAGSGSFDASGFTLNYSAVDVVDNHPFFVLAIEEEASGAVPSGILRPIRQDQSRLIAALQL